MPLIVYFVWFMNCSSLLYRLVCTVRRTGAPKFSIKVMRVISPQDVDIVSMRSACWNSYCRFHHKSYPFDHTRGHFRPKMFHLSYGLTLDLTSLHNENMHVLLITFSVAGMAQIYRDSAQRILCQRYSTIL